MLATHDVQILGAMFQKDVRVRIDDFLEGDAASALRAELASAQGFKYACNLDGHNVKFSESELHAMSAEDRTELNRRLIEDAAKGVGFFYGSRVLESAATPDTSISIENLYDFVNSGPVLDLVRGVTGYEDIVGADAQITRYTAGNYLTRHVDDVTGDNRRLAYVLSLTEQWHPDWGGLLQFYERSGAPRDAWVPGPNHLSLFDVGHVHSVTYVTPFAAAPRYSLTGWFRAAG